MLTGNDVSPKKKIVLFLPGISGKAFSERFQPLVDVCTRLNLPIARMSAWEGEQEAHAKMWRYFQQAIEGAIGHLLQLGYVDVIVVGKSFGGGVLLSCHHPRISKKILSIRFIHVDSSEIYIIHGTSYDVMPIENSHAAVAAVQRGTLVEIPEAGHSFKTPKKEQELMEITQHFLSE